MAWQDVALAVLTLVFMAGLAPSVLERRTQIPRRTSVPTALAAWMQAGIFATLGLWWTAAGTGIIALAWTYLALFRPVRPERDTTA